MYTLQSSSKVSPMNLNVCQCVAAESMMNYLIEYEYAMYKPFPSSRDCELNIARYKDDINVIQNCMVEINNGIRTVLSTNRCVLCCTGHPEYVRNVCENA
eukprot:252715_1